MRSSLVSTKSPSYVDAAVTADAAFKKRKSLFFNADSTYDTQLAAQVPYKIYDLTDFLGIFAFYRKVPAYVGPLFTLRRASDNAEKDFDDPSDTVAWLSGTTGYVKVWYDQSGLAKHFSETSTGNQPTFIYQDGPMGYLPSMQIGSLGMTGTITNTATANHCYTMGFVTYTSGNRILAGSNNWLVGPYSGVYNIHDNGFSGGSSVQLNVGKVQSAYRFSGSVYQNRVNGAAVGGTTGGASGAGTLHLGNRGAFGEPSGSRISELLFKDNMNLAKIVAMEALINSRYNLY